MKVQTVTLTIKTDEDNANPEHWDFVDLLGDEVRVDAAGPVTFIEDEEDDL